MNKIRLVFTRRPTLYSWLIRASTQYPFMTKFDTALGWSHVAVVLNDGHHIIDSVIGKGVRLRTLQSLIEVEGTQHIYGWLETPSTPNEGWLFDQIGKGYDTSALPAFLVPDWIKFRRNWQERDKWFCSELAASWALNAGHRLPEMPRFVSPNDLALLAGLR